MPEEEFNFIEFTPTGGRFTPSVSISRNGFGISAGFARKYSESVDATKGVKLYFDKDKAAIGMRFVPTTEEGALKMKPLNKGGYYINARSFLVKYDINRETHEARYVPIEKNAAVGKLFVISLKKKKTSLS